MPDPTSTAARSRYYGRPNRPRPQATPQEPKDSPIVRLLRDRELVDPATCDEADYAVSIVLRSGKRYDHVIVWALEYDNRFVRVHHLFQAGSKMDGRRVYIDVAEIAAIEGTTHE